MSLVSLKPFEDVDYYVVKDWWKRHRMRPIPLRLLPPLGHLVYFDGKPTAAAWAYMDNGGTGVALLGWVVSNPDQPGRVVHTCIAELVDFTAQRLRALNYRAVFCSINVPGLVKMFESMGFVAGDTGSTHLLKTL